MNHGMSPTATSLDSGALFMIETEILHREVAIK